MLRNVVGANERNRQYDAETSIETRIVGSIMETGMIVNRDRSILIFVRNGEYLQVIFC